jgi:hypothetical protein
VCVCVCACVCVCVCVCVVCVCVVCVCVVCVVCVFLCINIGTDLAETVEQLTAPQRSYQEEEDTCISYESLVPSSCLHLRGLF